MIVVLVLAAFALLAAGTWRQTKLIFGRHPSPRNRRALLCGGYALLALSLFVVLFGRDPSRMLVEWFGLLTVAAIVPLLACWQR